MDKLVKLFDALVYDKPRVIPEVPYEVLEFRRHKESPEFKKKGLEARQKFIEDFYKIDKVKDYYETKWKNELYNRDCVLNLLEYRKNCKEEEYEKINEKLHEFHKAMGSQAFIYPALRLEERWYEEI